MSGLGLEGVLRDHVLVADVYSPLCSCKRFRDKRDFDRSKYAAHVAAEVRKWIAGQLEGEGLREAVARSVEGRPAEMSETGPLVVHEVRRCYSNGIATAALTTVRDHLVGGAAEEGSK